jgi:hypothetical protein
MKEQLVSKITLRHDVAHCCRGKLNQKASPTNEGAIGFKDRLRQDAAHGRGGDKSGDRLLVE